MNDVIDAEHTAIAIRDEVPPQANLALFGTSDPVDVIQRATRVADALKAVVVSKKLVSVIQGKEYPQVEAWQTLAVMLGLAAVCEWTRQVPDGWEARVVVQRNGLTIAAAEAQCLRSEKTKKSWEDYAIRSMAQTRATSKSLRSVLGFVMVLAGYQATPAEEMPGDATPKPQPTKAAPPTQDDDTKRKNGLAAVHILKKERHLSDNLYHALLIELFSEACFDEHGVPSSTMLDYRQLRQLYAVMNERTKPEEVPA